MIKNYHTVAEVAERLGVTAESVRRYIREKKLEATKDTSVGIKKIWVVRHEDLEKFIEKLTSLN